MSAALRYELARVRTLRSTWSLLALCVLTTAGIAVAIAAWDAGNDIALGAFGRSSALTAGSAFTPVPLPAVLIGLVGAFAIGHEYRYDTIRPTLAVLPRRGPLFVAKSLVAAGFAIVASALSIGAAYLALVLYPGHRLLDEPMAWDPVGRVLVGFVVLGVLWTLVGIAFAGLSRNLPAAIVLMTVIPMIVESILALVLRQVPAFDEIEWWATYLPFSAGQAMLAVDLPFGLGRPDFEALGPVGGGLTFGAFSLGLWVLTWAVFSRRDA